MGFECQLWYLLEGWHQASHLTLQNLIFSWWNKENRIYQDELFLEFKIIIYVRHTHNPPRNSCSVFISSVLTQLWITKIKWENLLSYTEVKTPWRPHPPADVTLVAPTSRNKVALDISWVHEDCFFLSNSPVQAWQSPRGQSPPDRFTLWLKNLYF